MTWLLRRFARFRRGGGPLACYLRENGPIAYLCEIFGGDPRDRASALLATELAWYWRTTGGDAGVREWTRLTAWSLAALLADLGQPTAASRPPLVVIGVESAEAPSEVDDPRAAEWMRRFDAGADRPLHAVITRDPPDRELLFVAQHPPDAVVQLLQTWDIDRDRAERRAYPRLGKRTLDAVARTLVGGL